MDTEKLIEILNNILKEKDISQKISSIKTFQEVMWNRKYTEDNEILLDTLRDLAHDLDYYEPNSGLRKEDTFFYGNERLENEIHNALNKIDKIRNS